MQKNPIRPHRKPKLSDVPFYEMNLAEFPLFLLTKKAEKDFIEYEDEINYQGKTMKRYWKVTWNVRTDGSSQNIAHETKLQPIPPTPFVRRVFFTILQNIRDDHFESPVIKFTSRRHILRNIYPNRHPSNSDYAVLDQALECLGNMKILAINSFWNPSTNKIKEKEIDFYLFSSIRKERDIAGDGTIDEKALEFVLNPELFSSIKSGGFFWINAHIDDLNELSDTAFRYIILLTKKSYHDAFLKRNFKEFIKQIPLYQAKSKEELTDADIRKAKYSITDAHKELVAKGYIFDLKEPVYYKSNGELMIQIPDLKCIQTTLDLPAIEDKSKPELSYDEIGVLASKIATVTGDSKSRGSWILIARNLPADSVNECLKDIEEAKRSGYVGNYAAIFTHYIIRVAARLKIDPWTKRGTPRISEEVKEEKVVVLKPEKPNDLLNELCDTFKGLKTKKELNDILTAFPLTAIREALDASYDHIAKLMHEGTPLPEIATEAVFKYFEYYLRKSAEEDSQQTSLSLS